MDGRGLGASCDNADADGFNAGGSDGRIDTGWCADIGGGLADGSRAASASAECEAEAEAEFSASGGGSNGAIDGGGNRCDESGAGADEAEAARCASAPFSPLGAGAAEGELDGDG